MPVDIDELLKETKKSPIQEKLEKVTGVELAAVMVTKTAAGTDVEEPEKERFLARFNRPIVRGEAGTFGKTYTESDDWRMVELAKLFGFGPEILSRLEYSQEEIVNRTNAAELMLGIEQIKLLRQIVALLTVNKP